MFLTILHVIPPRTLLNQPSAHNSPFLLHFPEDHSITSSRSSTHLMHRSPPLPLTREVWLVSLPSERDLPSLIVKLYSVHLLRSSGVTEPVLISSWNPPPCLGRGLFSRYTMCVLLCSSWHCIVLIRGVWYTVSIPEDLPRREKVCCQMSAIGI